MKNASNIIVRKPRVKVSKSPRIIDAIYNGGFHEYEDAADYVIPTVPLKGARVG